ncbi:hypothetical protein BE221DRAFT_94147 [Ostreococcus tauri]|uniref:Uncharacterized protein n=1 Tax=Ostreococcus tauri TaxID=70448 RepID=A0A1Y5IBW9_OSTTA|nr:hypothetical protein BE221DRAFT_94147 [Ostreococcus tauri]
MRVERYSNKDSVLDITRRFANLSPTLEQELGRLELVEHAVSSLRRERILGAKVVEVTAHGVQRTVHLTVRRLTRRRVVPSILRHPRIRHCARLVDGLLPSLGAGRHLQRGLYLLDDRLRVRGVSSLFTFTESEERARLRYERRSTKIRVVS